MRYCGTSGVYIPSAGFISSAGFIYPVRQSGVCIIHTNDARDIKNSYLQNVETDGAPYNIRITVTMIVSSGLC